MPYPVRKGPGIINPHRQIAFRIFHQLSVKGIALFKIAFFQIGGGQGIIDNPSADIADIVIILQHSLTVGDPLIQPSVVDGFFRAL